MLVINANQEQKQVFNSLIEEMDAQVVWNGRFVIMGDRLVLEGVVRSLFFHFDIQKTEVQLIDLSADEEEEVEMTEHPELEELITIAVYAFEKWGALKGVHVEQDVEQLDHIFAEILGAYDMEVFFSEEKLEFYQSGIRITYEDVIEAVLSFTGVKMLTPRLQLPVAGRQNTQTIQEAVWPQTASDVFGTSMANAASVIFGSGSEKEERIEKYHARIGVLDRLSDLQRKTLLRDIRGDKLLNDAEKQELSYPIEDYERQLEEQKASNHAAATADAKATAAAIEKYIARIGVLERLSQLQRKTLLRDIRGDKLLSDAEKETLSYPIEDYERQLEKQAAAKDASALQRDPKAVSDRIEKYIARIGVLDRLSELQRKTLVRDIRNDRLLTDREKEKLYDPIEDYERQQAAHAAQMGVTEEKSPVLERRAPADATASAPARDSKAVRDRIEKYIARIGVLDRLSDLQKKTLVRDIRNDRLLNNQEKEKLYYPIQDYEYQMKMQELEQILSQKINRTYGTLKRMIEQAKKEDMFEETKKAVMERLQDLYMQLGIQEVQAIMERVPQHVERAEYQELLEKLAPYEDINLGAYQEQLRKMRETLEIKEISNLLMQSQKKDRKDYMDLLRKIEEQGFAKENAAPYIDRILDWVSELDEARLKGMLSNIKTMDRETARNVYQTIRTESFLPALRKQALEAVSRRLEQISLSECSVFVRVLENAVNGVVSENPRHHFYPAQKILTKTARPEDVKLIENAVSAYAEKRDRFECPILMVDTSRECSGRDGMLLTTQNLFYSSRMNGYRVPLHVLKGIYISSGLLSHRSLIAEDASGVRHKLPCVLEGDEMKEWAKVLDRFVRYLQDKAPQLGTLADGPADGMGYCRRCGRMYQEGEQACPECGLPNVITPGEP